MTHLIFNLSAGGVISAPEAVILPDGVDLSLTSDIYCLGAAVVCIRRGGKTVFRYKLTGGETVDVSDAFLFAGTAEIEITLIAKGEVAKTFRVIPFAVKEVGGTFSLLPEYKALKSEVETLRAAIADLAALVKEGETI